jgi:hypothetical protein
MVISPPYIEAVTARVLNRCDLGAGGRPEHRQLARGALIEELLALVMALRAIALRPEVGERVPARVAVLPDDLEDVGRHVHRYGGEAQARLNSASLIFRTLHLPLNVSPLVILLNLSKGNSICDPRFLRLSAAFFILWNFSTARGE